MIGETNTKMVRVVFVSQFEPKPVGHGGNHRAYQIVHDLKCVVGSDRVTVVTWSDWQTAWREKSAAQIDKKREFEGLRQLGREIAPVRLAYRMWQEGRRKADSFLDRVSFLFADHPIDRMVGIGRTLKTFASPEFSDYYEDIVQRMDGSIVCVIEHMGFANLLSVNSRYSIPTIACIQNLESFDTAVPILSDQHRMPYLKAVDFADELMALAQCEMRLFISKVETGLVEGLGLSSGYYPYLPVGKIRRDLERVREARTGSKRDSGLFLMLGSASHETTWRSFLWFVQQAEQYGLPEGIRVVVGGKKTDQLLPAGHAVPGLELRGWLEQDELDDLLVRAQGVLAPQLMGFGGLTRLPELSCAGIPVIVSRHPAYAIDVPPGVIVVDNSWEAWCKKMQFIADKDIHPRRDEYLQWENEQARPMEAILREWL